MINDQNNSEEKILYVSLIGKPNSGKSSLVNHIINKKISAISNKPNTTTNIIRGVYMENKTQIIFIDAPGISYKIGSTAKNEIAKSTINEDNINLFLFPANEYFDKHVLALSKLINPKNKIALITKIDLISKSKLLPMTTKLQEMGFENILYISVIKKDGINNLKFFLLSNAKSGNWEFSPTENSDRTIFDLMKEATKEVLFTKLYKELPYEIKITNGEIKTNEKKEYIVYQYLDFKKNAHHILLGQIKDISIAAAKNMEEYLDKKVHLYLFLIDSSQKKKR